MLVLATWLAADPLVLLAVDLPAMLLTILQGAPSILILDANAYYGVLAVASHLTLVLLQGASAALRLLNSTDYRCLVMLVTFQLLMPQLHRLNSLICLLEEGLFNGVGRGRRRLEKLILINDLGPTLLIILIFLFLFETELRLVTFLA